MYYTIGDNVSGLELRSDSEDENGDSTLEDQVQEAMGQLPLQSPSSPLSEPSSVPVNHDKNEDDIQRDFFLKGCGCLNHCDMLFSRQHVDKMRSSCFELNVSELDSIILGQLSAFGSVYSSVGISSRHSPKEREKPRFLYQHQGEKICHNMLFFYTLLGQREGGI